MNQKQPSLDIIEKKIKAVLEPVKKAGGTYIVSIALTNGEGTIGLNGANCDLLVLNRMTTNRIYDIPQK